MRLKAIFITLVVFTCFCGALSAQGSDDYKQFREDFSAAKTSEEKLDLAKRFMLANEKSEEATGVLITAVAFCEHQLREPERGIEFVESLRKKVKDPALAKRLKLAQAHLYSVTGWVDEFVALLGEFPAENQLDWRELDSFAKAAFKLKLWNRTLSYTDAFLQKYTYEFAKEVYKERYGDRIVRMIYSRKRAENQIRKAAALLHFDKPQEALTALHNAREVFPPNFLGIASLDYSYYIGHAHRKLGQYDLAFEAFGIHGLYGGNEKSTQALRETYVEAKDSEAGYEDFLWSLRLKLAKPAPDFTLSDFSGKQFSLNEFRGKVVLLNFWSYG